MRLLYYARLSIVLVIILKVVNPIAAQEIKTFRARLGSLEFAPLPEVGYIFRFGPETETFRPQNHLSSKGVELKFRIIPGLDEIGFKLDNGIEYVYGSTSALATGQRALQEYPRHRVVSMLFEGEGKSRLEIMLKGKTPVIRVDLQVGERKLNLWSARQPDTPKK